VLSAKKTIFSIRVSPLILIISLGWIRGKKIMNKRFVWKNGMHGIEAMSLMESIFFNHSLYSNNE
jgi:hypothetical protein